MTIFDAKKLVIVPAKSPFAYASGLSGSVSLLILGEDASIYSSLAESRYRESEPGLRPFAKF